MIRVLTIAALALGLPAAAQTGDELVGQAQAAYYADDDASCADLYARAFDAGAGTSRAYYDAACCASLADRPETALGWLHDAIAAGYRNVDWLGRDADLAALRDRPEWPAVMAAAEAGQARWLASVDADLYAIYQEDQADRMTRPIDWDAVSVRDSLRRLAVADRLVAGAARTADDYVHAAMVYQHSDTPEGILVANALVRRAVELDSTHAFARQLTAMTHDRYLWYTGRPQVYGTQFKRGPDGLWTFEPFDPDGVTDAQRVAAGSLTLEAKYEWLERRNAALSTPSGED